MIRPQTLLTRPYIDVTFAPGVAGELQGINGDEIVLGGPGVANLVLNGTSYIWGTPTKIGPNTYRYAVQTKTTGFVDGEIQVSLPPDRWSVKRTSDNAVISNGRGSGQFTLSTTAQDSGATTGDVTLGPLTLKGPSIGLANTTIDGGKLILTVAIELNEASLSFGSPGASGITAKLTGIRGTFDVQVDLLLAVQALSDPAGLAAAFSVPGKWDLTVAGLEIKVPNVVTVLGSGIQIHVDPNYDPAKHGGAPQEIVVVNSASVSFPSLGVTGLIAPYSDGTTTIPGLVVRSNGFQLGRAELQFRPGGPGAGSAIKLGSILEFDDLRIGVENFGVTFGQAVDFNGNIYFASGGVRFLPGKPISATISDRPGAEPGTDPNNTEALRATLEFEHGQVKAFRFNADTMRITLGSFLTITARDFMIDTGAAADEPMVSFGAVGAEVTLGSFTIAGEARHFAFLGDGSFRTDPGFGVFLSVGGATGDNFKWPSWLPIQINSIGIEWADIQHDPGDFVLTLSASVTGIKGVSGLEFSGTIEGVKIDIGKLIAGEFPIIDIASIGVTVKGKMFGGEIDAALIGGILKLDSGGRIIESFDTTTPVDARVFFVGVQGGFKMPGVGGLSIRFALSELGPLSVFLSVSLPTGIMLVPQIGLVMNDFTAGVEFFKTLPSIDDPIKLRGPDFQVPGNVSAENWLATVKQQVATQYLILKNDPSKSGFAAAFTAPMTITGSAKIYSLYTSKQVFNGQVVVKISTDGKFLIIGKLNFADDNLSISGRLYADLSKVSQGDVTVLFLADIPDQVRLLTIYGKLKMGFRDASGNEVEFTVPDEPPLTPTASLAGPRDGDNVSVGDINSRGFVDVQFSDPDGLPPRRDVDHRHRGPSST